MCRHHAGHRQPPIVALAGAIYSAYQSRKDKKADASAQEIGIEGGKYAAVPQLQSPPDTMDKLAFHEKSDMPPPDYDDVVRNGETELYHGMDSKDHGPGLGNEGDDERAFLAEGEDYDGKARLAEGERDGVKMSFFERLQAKREGKMEKRRAWMEGRAERRAEWRAGRGGRRACGKHAC